MEMNMATLEGWRAVLVLIKSSEKYAEGIAHGKPRTGHAEGTVKNHLEDLDRNLQRLIDAKLVDDLQAAKLAVLIHVHDTLKLWAKRDAPIKDPQSHASLAKIFLEDIINEVDED